MFHVLRVNVRAFFLIIVLFGCKIILFNNRSVHFLITATDASNEADFNESKMAVFCVGDFQTLCHDRLLKGSEVCHGI